MVGKLRIPLIPEPGAPPAHLRQISVRSHVITSFQMWHISAGTMICMSFITSVSLWFSFSFSLFLLSTLRGGISCPPPVNLLYEVCYMVWCIQHSLTFWLPQNPNIGALRLHRISWYLCSLWGGQSHHITLCISSACNRSNFWPTNHLDIHSSAIDEWYLPNCWKWFWVFTIIGGRYSHSRTFPFVRAFFFFFNSVMWNSPLYIVDMFYDHRLMKKWFWPMA